MKNFKNVLQKCFSTALLLMLLGIVFSCQSKHTEKNPLLGSWSLEEVRWISADTIHSLKKTQLGMLLITPKNYSVMWSPSQTERTPFKELSNPTDEEIISGFRSIVFNAGTYVHTDSTMKTTASIAKVPGFEGGSQFYNYAIKRNQLTLTMHDELYPNGKKPKWSGIWRTTFLFTKTITE